MLTNFTYILIILSAIVINVIAIRRYSYDDKMNRTCDDYILNTYLYVILAFLIFSFMTTFLLESKHISKSIISLFDNWINVIIYLIVYAILYTLLGKTNPRNEIQSHGIWLLLMIMLGVLMFVPVVTMKATNLLYTTITITLAIVITLAYVGVKYGDVLVNSNLDKYLTYALVGLIVLSLLVVYVPQLFAGMTGYQMILMLSIPGLIIFSLLLLSYNKKLADRAQQCYKDNNPNYPLESVGLIVKIINIALDVFRLLYARKNKKRLSSIKLK